MHPYSPGRDRERTRSGQVTRPMTKYSVSEHFLNYQPPIHELRQTVAVLSCYLQEGTCTLSESCNFWKSFNLFSMLMCKQSCMLGISRIADFPWTSLPSCIIIFDFLHTNVDFLHTNEVPSCILIRYRFTNQRRSKQYKQYTRPDLPATSEPCLEKYIMYSK